MNKCSIHKTYPVLHRLLSLTACLMMILAASSCSITKRVPEGELLYTGSELEFQHADSISHRIIKRELEDLYAPRANRRLLGLPFRLWAYNLFYTKKETGLIHWLQSNLGEPPVLYDPKITRTVERLMENRSFNRGFFNAEVDSRVDSSGKKAEVLYHVALEAPYRFQEYKMAIQNEAIAGHLAGLPPSPHIKAGNQYNLEALKSERERVAQWLSKKGYFYFDPNYLKFIGDTISGQRKVSLELVLKEDTPKEDLRPMYISDIQVYPNFRLNQAADLQQMEVDSITFNYEELNVRPNTLLNAILFKRGDRYHVDLHQRTQERLLNLPVFQFVNIRFQRAPQSDSLLQMQVFLTPRKPNTIEGSVGLSHKSTGFLGPEINATYINRNLFKGAELLRISGNASFNFPLSSNTRQYYQEIEGLASITRPGLLFPFLPQSFRDKLIGSGTSLELRFAQERARFPLKADTVSAASLISILEEASFPSLAEKLRQDSTYAPFIGVQELEITYGYRWRARPQVIHEFNPLHFRFQNGTFEDGELRKLLLIVNILQDNLERSLNLERMFIFQPEYIFNFDSRRLALKSHNYFFQGRIAYAGNEVIPGKKTDLNLGKLESQFFQLETDTRYFLITGGQHTLATRFVANASFPLDQELILPFFDFYTVGGPNSVRAYATREIGPGATDPADGAFTLLQGRGDIKLESSLEYRRRLSKYFELAFFLDAGNVWLFENRGDDQKEKFNFNTFYKELASGTGMGLRVNISGLVVRLDLAFPLSKPWLDPGRRWVLDEVDFGDPSWRRDNLQWHLAFGYPF